MGARSIVGTTDHMPSPIRFDRMLTKQREQKSIHVIVYAADLESMLATHAATVAHLEAQLAACRCGTAASVRTTATPNARELRRC